MSGTVFIGIDPGSSSGGIAVIETDRVYCTKLEGATASDIVDILRISANSFAILERVGPARGRDGRKQGVSSTFKFGANFGMLQGVLASLEIPYELVTPGVWQKAMGCLSKGDKNVTKAAAQRLFPSLKITHATADALLLAEYGRRIFNARNGR